MSFCVLLFYTAIFIADIWILGDSIPRWAGAHATERGSTNLKLPGHKTIGWWGISGMHWFDFRKAIEANVLLSRPPDIVAINLGGNDLTSSSLTKLRNVIAREIRYLRSALPQARIIWVDILQRLSWMGDYPQQIVERKRRRINRWGRQQVKAGGQWDILTIDIDSSTPGFYAHDGVHLSLVGLEFYLDSLRDVLLKYVG